MAGNPDKKSDKPPELADRINLALQAASAAVWDWDIEQKSFWSTPGVQLLFGRDGDDNTGRFDLEDEDNPWTSSLHPADRAWVVQCLRDHLENDTPYDVEYRYSLPSGEYVWIRSVGRAIRDADGKPLRMVGTNFDITDQKTTEDALIESEGRLRLITDNLPAFVAYIDSDGYYRYANRHYEVWFTRPVDKIVGHHIEDVMGSENFAVISETHKKALSGEAATRFGEFVSTDGRKSHVFAHYVPAFGPGGVVRGYYVMSHDVTELKHTEEALRESEARLAEAQQLANVGSWVLYVEGDRQIKTA